MDEPSFWSAFPAEPKAFEEKVRQGIWYIVPVDNHPDRPVLVAEQKLPEPPEGYIWWLDPETLISGEAITFKLRVK